MMNIKVFLKGTEKSLSRNMIRKKKLTEGYILIDVFVSLVILSFAMVMISSLIYSPIKLLEKRKMVFRILITEENKFISESQLIYEKK